MKCYCPASHTQHRQHKAVVGSASRCNLLQAETNTCSRVQDFGWWASFFKPCKPPVFHAISQVQGFFAMALLFAVIGLYFHPLRRHAGMLMLLYRCENEVSERCDVHTTICCCHSQPDYLAYCAGRCTCTPAKHMYHLVSSAAILAVASCSVATAVFL